MDLFSNCTTLEEATEVYKQAVKVVHPDKGGDADEFMALKTAYDDFRRSFKGDSLTDRQVCDILNNGEFIDPVVFRDYQSRPNLTEWYDKIKGRWWIGTLEDYEDYELRLSEAPKRVRYSGFTKALLKATGEWTDDDENGLTH